MATIWPLRIVTAQLAAGDLTLKPVKGEVYEILSIGIDGGASDVIIQVYQRKRFLFNAPAEHDHEHILPMLYWGTNYFEFLPQVEQRLPGFGKIYVGEDEEFRVSSGGLSAFCIVKYKTIAPDQMPPLGSPGTFGASKRIFISHGRGSSSVPAGGTATFGIETPLNYKTEHEFPFVGAVPKGSKFVLHAFMTNRDAASGPNIVYKYFRIHHEDDVLLHPDRGWTMPSFPYPNNTAVRPIPWLPEPRIFRENERMKIEVQCDNLGVGVETAIINFTFLFTEEPAGE